MTNSIIFRKLLCLYKPFRFQLIAISFCLVFFTLSSLAQPIISSKLIDLGILGRDYQIVIMLSLLGLLLVVVNAVLNVLKEKVRAHIASKIKQKLVVDAYNSLTSIKIQHFSTMNTTEFLTNLEMDTSRICTICDSEVFSIITQLLGFVGGIIGLFIIDARLALIVFVTVPIKFFTVNILAKRKRALVDDLLVADTKYGRWFGDNLDGMKEIRLFGLQDAKRIELAGNIENRSEAERKINILDSYNKNSETLYAHFLEAILYIVGAYFIFRDTLSVGSLFAFLTYSLQVTSPISTALNISYMMSGIMPSARRYFSLLESEMEENELEGRHILEHIERIEFQNVSLCYDRDMHVLDRVSFSIANGEKVALIGRNGTGKTTIFNLIERFLVPTKGRILVNGMDVKDYDIRSYRRAFSCINQSSYLFNLPILENITLSELFTDEDIKRAIELSDLSELVNENTRPIGCNGQFLSGGQRQKIIFARTILRNKSFYLLDEFTSNLDKESEYIVTRVFNRFLHDKTVLLIAHSLNVLTFMDRIIKLDGQGGIVEYKSYQELLRKEEQLVELLNQNQG